MRLDRSIATLVTIGPLTLMIIEILEQLWQVSLIMYVFEESDNIQSHSSIASVSLSYLP